MTQPLIIITEALANWHTTKTKLTNHCTDRNNKLHTQDHGCVVIAIYVFTITLYIYKYVTEVIELDKEKTILLHTMQSTTYKFINYEDILSPLYSHMYLLWHTYIAS